LGLSSNGSGQEPSKFLM